MSNIALPANVTNSHAMISLFAEYIEHHKGSVVYGEKRAECTVQAYENKRKLLCQYLAYCDRLDITPEQFSVKHLEKYFEFLIRRGYKHNYAARCAEILIKVVRFSVLEGRAPYNQLADFSVKKIPAGPVEFIVRSELARIEAYCPTGSMIEKAKAMFLFQCWSGMDYKCTMAVRESHLQVHKGVEYIIKNREKPPHVQAVIPLSDKCAELFASHDYRMALLSNAKYNLALKTIGQDNKIATLLTSHIGRKTFAMHKLNYEGYSVQAVSKMMGHRQIKTTEQAYVNTTLELVHSEFCKLKQSA